MIKPYSRFKSIQSKLPFPQLSSTVLEFPTVDENTETEEPQEFNWFQAWYPLVPIEFLDPSKPHAFKILGMDIVLWNDGPMDKSSVFGPKKNRAKGSKKINGNWRTFIDQCPHRKVPLSEGRIEDDGSLLCSYHGWRFDGEGSVVSIPQLISDSEFDRFRSNPKSSCNSLPVKIVDGLLWIWPDASEDSKLESLLTEVPGLPLGDVKEENVWKGNWNFRELPYGHDFFIENVVDPAHVGVSHHNIVGSRYSDQRMVVKAGNALTKKGFSILTSIPGNTDLPSSTTFNAPSQVLIEQTFGKNGAKQFLELYSSPSRPGFANHVGRIVIVKDSSGNTPSFLKMFTLPLPTWINHIMSSAFLNQDALFLHTQERTMAHNNMYKGSMPGSKDRYEDSVYPIFADRGVLNFRTWMRMFAGGHIPFRGDTTMPASSKEVVFDVYNSHTKHCKYCMTALKNLKKARLMSFVAAATLGVARPSKLGALGSTFGALGLSLLGAVINKLIGLFYRYEFSHADNH